MCDVLDVCVYPDLTRATVERVYLEGFPLRHATFSAGGSRQGAPASQSSPAPLSSSSSSSSSSTGASSFLDKAYDHFLSRHLLPANNMNLPRPDDLRSLTSELSLDSMAASFHQLERERPAAPVPPHSADSTLLRRAEVLLRAEYILTGKWMSE